RIERKSIFAADDADLRGFTRIKPEKGAGRADPAGPGPIRVIRADPWPKAFALSAPIRVNPWLKSSCPIRVHPRRSVAKSACLALHPRRSLGEAQDPARAEHLEGQ